MRGNATIAKKNRRDNEGNFYSRKLRKQWNPRGGTALRKMSMPIAVHR